MNNKGFTLIEILIAITIMSLMVLGVYTIIDDSMKTQNTIIFEDREYLQTQVAMARIESDFQQIYSPLYYSLMEKFKESEDKKSKNDNAQEVVKNLFPKTTNFPTSQEGGLPVPLLENPGPSSLLFYTSSHRRRVMSENASRYAWVQYYIRPSEDNESDNDTENLRPQGLSTLIRKIITQDLYNDQLDWDSQREQILLRGIKDFKFEFWEKKKEQWVPRLRDLSKDEQKTPRTIRVSLTHIDKSGLEYDHVRVFRSSWPIIDLKKEQSDLKKESSKSKTPNQN